MNIHPIAYFHSPFSSKFGIPKQSGLVEELEGRIVFAPEYRNADYIRGLQGFDYIWLIWEFSDNRHPFRPNALGLSSVRIQRIELDSTSGPVIHVLGADLMDGTPIYDIKPYIVYADCHPDARSGFVDSRSWPKLEVVIPEEIAKNYQPERLSVLRKILELDPRPHYQNDPKRIYGMPFDGTDVRFFVENGVLTVIR